MQKIMRKYSQKRKLTPMRAIKIYCKEMCCAGDMMSWKECTFDACPLFELRIGKRKQRNNKKTPTFTHKDLKKSTLEKQQALNYEK